MVFGSKSVVIICLSNATNLKFGQGHSIDERKVS